MNSFDYLAMKTLFQKECKRFLKVKAQTLYAPVLTAFMYVLVFHYAMGDRQVPGLAVDYFRFLIPGLAMMVLLQNAFANTSSSIIVAKVMKIHVYLLMAPLSSLEVIIAFIAAAVCRAFLVAGLVLLLLSPFADFSTQHLFYALSFALCAAIMMAALGLIAGMFAKQFDDLAVMNNFVIMPLSFLSGVFYSISQLPDVWQWVNRGNPFFYLIDGFRYALIGVGDSHPAAALGLLWLLCSLIVFTAWLLWERGWCLKD